MNVDEESKYDERMPPWDESAEQSVLGAMMLAPQAVSDVTDVLSVTGAEFYRPAHQAIYTAIIHVAYQGGERADPVTVASELERRGELVRVGGRPYLHTLMSVVPTAVNADHYAAIVAEKSALRGLVEAGTRVVQLGYAGSDGAAIEEVLEKARAAVDNATAGYRNRRQDEGIDVDELAFATLDRYAQPMPSCLPTGFSDLDEILSGGLRAEKLYIIGARPAVGKSLVALNIAVQAAKAGTGTVFASLEMSRDEIMDRINAQLGGVELDRINRHVLSEGDWGRVQRVAENLANVPFRIEDTPHLSMAKLRSLARDRTRHPAGLGLVVVDYVQLMRVADTRVSREQQVAAFSRELKLLSKELHVPVIALSQLNRGVESRTIKRPVLADLRESGAIEQDADVILLLWDDAEKSGERQVVVAKNRQGRIGDISLAWSPHYARAGNLSRSHLHAV